MEAETDGKRRFCDSCTKHVHDFGALEEHEAKALMKEHQRRGERMCVRYSTDRQGNIVFKDRARRALAAGAMALSMAACTHPAESKSLPEMGEPAVSVRGEIAIPQVEPEPEPLMGDIAVEPDPEPLPVPEPKLMGKIMPRDEPCDPEPAPAPAPDPEPTPDPEPDPNDARPVLMGEAPAIDVAPPDGEPSKAGQDAKPVTHARMGRIRTR